MRNDHRDDLEALLWQRITPRNPTEAGRQQVRNLVADIMAAADRYATAVACAEIDRIEGRARLAAASAEYHARPSTRKRGTRP